MLWAAFRWPGSDVGGGTTAPPTREQLTPAARYHYRDAHDADVDQGAAADAAAGAVADEHDINNSNNSNETDSSSPPSVVLRLADLTAASASVGSRMTVVVPHVSDATGRKTFNGSVTWPRHDFVLQAYTMAGTSMTVPDGSVVPRRVLVDFNMDEGADRQHQRQQLSDYMAVLAHVAKSPACVASGLFMLADDDVAPCRGFGALTRAALLQAAPLLATGAVRLVRLSVGTNGLVLRCDDVPSLVAHLRARAVNRRDGVYGVDTLIDEWAGDAGRLVFRTNMLHHAPAQPSTIWDEAERLVRDAELPACGELLRWRGPSFDGVACRHAWFTPCTSPALPAPPPAPPTAHFVTDGDAGTAALAHYLHVTGISLAPKGMSCAEACRREGTVCRPHLLRLANSCPVLRALEPRCGFCNMGSGAELPTTALHLHHVPDAAAAGGSTVAVNVDCVLQSADRLSTCAARWSHSARACVCAPRVPGEVLPPDDEHDMYGAAAPPSSSNGVRLRAPHRGRNSVSDRGDGDVAPGGGSGGGYAMPMPQLPGAPPSAAALG